MLVSMFLLLVAGCAGPPDSILLSGIVKDQPYGAGKPVADVTVTTRDDSFEETATGKTGSDGSFSLEIPAVSDFYVELSGSGFTPTLYAGEAGAYDLDAGDDVLFVRSEAAADELKTAFGSCAADKVGAIVEGEVRLFMDNIPYSDLLPVANAFASVIDGEGTVYQACYLDDKGGPAKGGSTTGATGRFGVFGLPEGPLQLDVGYSKLTDENDTSDPYDTGSGDDTGDSWHWYYRAWMLDGAIAPFYPAIVEMH
jgi:hypothetical protein